jgi:hypothetical protein
MSQSDVYAILVELGGKGSTSQIRQKAKEKYPKRTLYTYVVNRLKKLEAYGFVRLVYEREEEYWEITEIPFQ